MEDKIKISIKEIIAKQLVYPQDVNFGAIRCDMHDYHHASMIAILPFTMLYSLDQCDELLDRTTNFLNWICARQEPSGLWAFNEDKPINNVLVLLSLACSYVLVSKHLKKLDKAGIEEVLIRSMSWHVHHRISRKDRTEEGQKLLAVFTLLTKKIDFNIPVLDEKKEYFACAWKGYNSLKTLSYDDLWPCTVNTIQEHFKHKTYQPGCILPLVNEMFIKTLGMYSSINK